MRPVYTPEQLMEMFACYLIRGLTMPSGAILEKTLKWYCENISQPYELIVSAEIDNAVKRLCE